MRWFGLVLMFISIHCSSAFDICATEFPEIPGDDTKCILRNDTDQIGNIDKNVTCELDENATFTVLNSQKGILSVEYRLPHSSCGYTNYVFELQIEESLKDEQSCNTLSFIETVHSKRVLNTSRKPDKKLPYCKDTEKIIFNYVYTGCYVLSIFADRKDKSRNVITSMDSFVKPTFIETNYTKITLTDKIPNISNRYLSDKKVLDVDIKLDSIKDLQLCLYVSDNVKENSKDPCFRTGIMHTACKRTRSGNFMCKTKDNNADSSTQCRFNKHEDLMTCNIKNVTSDLYCVLMTIYDDRCEPHTLWNNGSLLKCVYHTIPINVTAAIASQTTVVVQSSSFPVFDIVISVVAVLCLVSLGMILYFWLRGKPKPKPVFPPKKQVLSQQKPSIVLLYALDCKPFMTLMSSFRDILREITKCEIYDCFDPECAEEISLNKADWLRNLMAISKIVLIENRCAVLHQKALLEHNRLKYRDTVSVFVDDLFSYGLKILTDDCFGRSMYEKVLVVRIEGFTETKDVLSHVAPLTRYSIPQHMEELLTSLCQSQSEYELDSRMLKFVECLKNLENYKTEKPEYLNTIIVKDYELLKIV